MPKWWCCWQAEGNYHKLSSYSPHLERMLGLSVEVGEGFIKSLHKSSTSGVGARWCNLVNISARPHQQQYQGNKISPIIWGNSAIIPAGTGDILHDSWGSQYNLCCVPVSSRASNECSQRLYNLHIWFYYDTMLNKWIPNWDVNAIIITDEWI